MCDGDIVIARTGATTGFVKCLKRPPNAIFASYLVRLRLYDTVDARAVEFNPSVRIDGQVEKPYVPMEALPIGSMVIDLDKVQQRSGTSGSKFQNRDTLLARITPSLENGKTGFVQFLPADDSVAIGSTEFIVMRTRLRAPAKIFSKSSCARSDPCLNSSIPLL